MRSPDLPRELVAQLSPSSLRSYALSVGWSTQDAVEGQFEVLHRRGADLDQVLIPLDEHVDDYTARMTEAISRIAEAAGQTPLRVLRAVLSPPADVVRFGIDGPDAISWDLPFEQGVSVVLGMKKSLRAAACSVVKPQPFHPRMSRVEVEQLMEGCRFRQTEGGSFTFVLACPLDAVDVSPTLFDRTPFARKATSNLVRSIAWITRSVDQGDTRRALDALEGEPQLSANLCDGLLDMQPRDDRSGLNIDIDWAWSVPPPEALRGTRGTRLRREHFSFITEVAHRLTPTSEQERQQLYVAYVDELKGKPDEHGAVQGEVVLSLLTEDVVVRARADLAPSEYGDAVDAHKWNRPVSFHGVLRRSRKVHRMDSVTGFRILDA